MESFFANLCRKTEFVHFLQFDDYKIVHIYKPQKIFWKVQHFGVLDCVYSEGIFCGVKNPAEMDGQKSSERNGNVKS